MKRYKDCSRPVRAWRWLRYVLPAYFSAANTSVWWLLSGARPMEGPRPATTCTRKETLRFIWRCIVNVAQCRAGNYQTIDEIMEQSRRKLRYRQSQKEKQP